MIYLLHLSREEGGKGKEEKGATSHSINLPLPGSKKGKERGGFLFFSSKTKKRREGLGTTTPFLKFGAPKVRKRRIRGGRALLIHPFQIGRRREKGKWFERTGN